MTAVSLSSSSTTFDASGVLINTTGANDIDGGDITISTTGLLAAGSLTTNGGYTVGNLGPSAGNVVLSSTGGNVSVSTINARGSNAYGGVDTGGNGGAVTITAGPASTISLSGDMRIASTAALTAGTRTLDTNAFAVTNGWAGSTLLTTGVVPLQQVELYQNGGNEYPIILANNEGIVITNAVAMGATGVMTVAVNIEWTESGSTAAGIAY
jgi:hypothetical protein